MPDLTELLQRSSGTEPNLRDIGASILRANVERTSVGQQLDTMQNQRSDLAQRGFQNELSLMEYQWQQTQAEASRGNAQAKNAMDTFQSVAADYAPEDRAKLWAAWTGGGDDSLTSLYGAVESLGLEPVTEETQASGLVGQYMSAQSNGLIPEGTSFQDFVAMTKQGSGVSVENKIIMPGDPGAATPLGTSATNAVESDAIDLSGQMQRLNAISQSFKPEFQETFTRAGFASTAMQEKLPEIFGELPEADKAKLAEFATFRQNAFENLSRVLNELSGAAISPAEFERLKEALPNPGTGLFDGDSPTEFKSKMDNAIWQSQLANARLLHLRSRGLSVGEDFGNISLGQMETIIQKRGEEIEAELRSNPAFQNANDQTIAAEAANRLRNEYGLF